MKKRKGKRNFFFFFMNERFFYQWMSHADTSSSNCDNTKLNVPSTWERIQKKHFYWQFSQLHFWRWNLKVYAMTTLCLHRWRNNIQFMATQKEKKRCLNWMRKCCQNRFTLGDDVEFSRIYSFWCVNLVPDERQKLRVVY